jgi:seryl-tRNA synthetase
MSVWVEEIGDWVAEEDLEVLKELLEEDKQLRKLEKKKKLLRKYRNKFSDEIKKKYGIQPDSRDTSRQD